MKSPRSDHFWFAGGRGAILRREYLSRTGSAEIQTLERGGDREEEHSQLPSRQADRSLGETPGSQE